MVDETKRNSNIKFYIILCSSVFIGSIIISNINLTSVQEFSTIFVSIILQAIPFLMIGTLISSTIHIFLSEEFIVRMFPEKSILSVISAVFIGVIVPSCDCGVIPVAARLAKKKVPMYAVIIFLLSAPVVNPIVIFSTYIAFPQYMKFIYLRIIAGIIIAILTGFIVNLLYFERDKNIVIDVNSFDEKCEKDCCCHNQLEDKNSKLDKVIETFRLTGEEFIQITKLFIIGAGITSFIQINLSGKILIGEDMNSVVAILFMMIMAFVMSICSTSDAFIARSYINKIPLPGVFAFIVYGPVFDLKNFLMMMGKFKKDFVIKFTAVSFIIAFSVILIIGSLVIG